MSFRVSGSVKLDDPDTTVTTALRDRKTRLRFREVPLVALLFQCASVCRICVVASLPLRSAVDVGEDSSRIGRAQRANGCHVRHAHELTASGRAP